MGWKWRTVGEACDRLDVLDVEEENTERALVELEQELLSEEKKAPIRERLMAALTVMVLERAEIRKALWVTLKEM